MNIASPLWHEKNYRPGSLIEQVEEESGSAVIKNSRISSLILKFYYLCVTWENPENPISYKDLESVYRDSQLLLMAKRTFRLGNNPFLPTERAMQIIRDNPRFWNHIQCVANELRMIGDIPTTTLIFRDIIERAIRTPKHREQFVGLDLGTGTGILIIALHILARKHACKETKLYWISDSELWVDHVRTVMRKLHCPAEIVEGDTTQKSTYNRMKIPHVSMVCNENIPYHAEWIHAEPFFHNIYALRESLRNGVDSDTQFFPDSVTITNNGAIVHDCSAQNNFLLGQIDLDKKRGSQYRYGEIRISGQSLPMKDFHLRAAEILWLPPCHDATIRW